MEENIKNTFHLPISYQETTKINDNIKSDLELLKTKELETKLHAWYSNRNEGFIGVIVNIWD